MSTLPSLYIRLFSQPVHTRIQLRAHPRALSPYFALAYAANDVVLIMMWTMAAVEDISYLSVIICFAMFLVNDLYGFISWKRMEKRQMAAA